MHAPTRVDVVQCLGELCYRYELFTLFTQKNRTPIYGLRPTWGVRCLTGGLTDARGKV
jgi:hypothetical protein